MCYTHILSTYMFLGGMKLHHQITIIITISLYVYTYFNNARKIALTVDCFVRYPEHLQQLPRPCVHN